MDVRYENGIKYVTFKRLGIDTIRYAWGMVGFGEKGSAIMTDKKQDSHSRLLRSEGYRIVEEAPVSEGSHADGGILLDWMSGVTR